MTYIAPKSRGGEAYRIEGVAEDPGHRLERRDADGYAVQRTIGVQAGDEGGCLGC
jgi:hypothetical protein